jgi:hypothetical protein
MIELCGHVVKIELALDADDVKLTIAGEDARCNELIAMFVPKQLVHNFLPGTSVIIKIVPSNAG